MTQNNLCGMHCTSSTCEIPHVIASYYKEPSTLQPNSWNTTA